MDNSYDTGSPVADWVCEQLHLGGIHPYPAGACRYHPGDQGHKGTQRPLTGGNSYKVTLGAAALEVNAGGDDRQKAG